MYCFFKANNKDEPCLDKNKLDSEIHFAGGCMSVFYTEYDYTWSCRGNKCPSTQGTGRIKYETIGIKLENEMELKIGIKINMKNKLFDIYLNDKYLGTTFKNIPNRIIPAIGLYGDVNKGDKISCSIHFQQI